MTLQERVIKVRNDAGLNQAEFGEKLNLGKSLISLAESGKRNYTDRVLSDICDKFNVNPDWLRTGEGEPYNETIPAIMKLLKAEYNLDELDVKIIEKYLELSPIERQVFKDYIKKTEKVEFKLTFSNPDTFETDFESEMLKIDVK